MKYNSSDVPITTLDDDAFSIERYVEAVASFIIQSDTPETIAIRGEWGSGKTSFMKMLESRLADKNVPVSSRFNSIWLNTWQLFVVNNQQEAIAKLYLDLASQLSSSIVRADKNHKSLINKKTAIQGLRNLSNLVLNLASIQTETLDRIWNDLSEDRATETLNVKQELERLITREINEKNNDVSNKGFLIFIDDLDRLEPKMAVTLLEALKNLFDIHGCVFILGMDYDVIRKGVEEKYGFKNVVDRDISRDFFDKIVQVPISLPTANYDVMPLVMDRLHGMNFFRNTYEYAFYSDSIHRIVSYSTNNNPRTIKTIMNTLQIMLSINSSGIVFCSYRLMLLLLVSLNKSFPDVYIHLARQPDLSKWEKDDFGDESHSSETQSISQPRWKRIVERLIGSNEMHQYDVNRTCELLSIFATLQTECSQRQLPVDDLFDSVNSINGFQVRQPSITVNGDDYVLSSSTENIIGSHLIETIDFAKHHKVLDVGCAIGKTTIEMWMKNPRMEITAIDISQSQIAQAVQKFDSLSETIKSSDVPNELSGTITFRVQDAMSIRVHDKYDLIVSNCVMHWISKMQLMYSKLFRALKPGGELAVSQGGKGTYRGLHDNARKAIENLKLQDKYKGWSFPASFLEPEAVERMLNAIGFVDVNVKSVKINNGESQNLVQDFTVASLIYYKTPELTEQEFMDLKTEFIRLCNSDDVDLFSHDLFIHGRKPDR